MTDTPTDPPEDRGLLWQRIQHQQEVRDRWFTYSLALLAVPLLMAAAFEKADLKDPYAVAGAMAIFAFVGFFFLLLYTDNGSTTWISINNTVRDPFRQPALICCFAPNYGALTSMPTVFRRA
jgi:hypothetical protein